MLRKHIAEDTGGIAVNYNEFKFLRRRRGAGIFRFCLPSSAAIVDVTFTATVPRTLIGLTVDETAEFERLDRLSPVDRSGKCLWDFEGEPKTPDEKRWLELYRKHEAGSSTWPVALSRFSETHVDIETLKTIVIFCGVGLTVSLVMASFGLDLSAEIF
jgi:hypothetical protein